MPQDRIHLSTPIISVKTLEATDGEKPEVVLTTDEGKELVFDRVILACHSDTSLDMLRAGNITEEEEHILSEFEWNRNEVILHADEMVCRSFPRSHNCSCIDHDLLQLMPRSRLAWSCWNYLSYTKSISTTKGVSDSEADELYADGKKTSQRNITVEVNSVTL